MTANPALQRFALGLLIASFAGLYGWLLLDTLGADSKVIPRDVQANLIPLFSGALGLVLAIALGVKPRVNATGFRDRLKAVFSTDGLLLTGAIVYLLSAVAGGFVWGFNQDATPELVTTVTLTVAGYFAATMTALAAPPA